MASSTAPPRTRETWRSCFEHGNDEQKVKYLGAADRWRDPQLLLDDRTDTAGPDPTGLRARRNSSTASGSSTGTSGSPPGRSAPSSRSPWSTRRRATTLRQRLDDPSCRWMTRLQPGPAGTGDGPPKGPGHREIPYEDRRVPEENLPVPGAGFLIAQTVKARAHPSL